MSLFGGFCLLGRLQHLESFSSGTWKKQGALNARNLKWVIEFGRTEDKKMRRQRYLAPVWKVFELLNRAGNDVLLDDATTVASHDLRSLASKKHERRFGWTAVDPTLRKEPRYLGLPVEVKTFFDALDGDDGCYCFPVLRHLSLCSPGGIELSPEREIKRVVVNKARRPWILP